MPGQFGTSDNDNGAFAYTKASDHFGVFGSNEATTPPTGGGAGGAGVFGLSVSPGAAGVFGANNSAQGVGVQGNGPDAGVSGFSDRGAGIRAHSNHANGVEGYAHDANGTAVLAINTATVAPTVQDGSPRGSGVLGVTTVPGSAGVFGANNSLTKGRGVQGNGPEAGVGGFSAGGRGVFGQGATGVEGQGQNVGVFGLGTGPNGIGVEGAGIQAGVKGEAGGPGLGHVGVLGRSGGLVPNPSDPIMTGALASESGALQTGGRGVLGIGINVGVQAIATTGHAVDALSIGGIGVAGGTSGSGPGAVGVLGLSRGGAGSLAGKFQGNVDIQGNLSKSGGGFKIDHPLAPAEKYLNHSFVESPERKNVYDGIAVLNHAGDAVVELPAWFESLNSDFRYQLTCIGSFAPVYVARKLCNHCFVISGGRAGMEISWQVTGIRVDSWAKSNPLPVEEDKSASERGGYGHPEKHSHDATVSSHSPEVETEALAVSP